MPPRSVRATNVYEERSLGVYEDDADALDDELNDDARWNAPAESRVAIWGKYLARHARRQLSFGEIYETAKDSECEMFNAFGDTDMWWLAVSLFLLCIVEVSAICASEAQSGGLVLTTSQRSSLTDSSKISYFNVFALSTFPLVRL